METRSTSTTFPLFFSCSGLVLLLGFVALPIFLLQRNDSNPNEFKGDDYAFAFAILAFAMGIILTLLQRHFHFHRIDYLVRRYRNSFFATGMTGYFAWLPLLWWLVVGILFGNNPAPDKAFDLAFIMMPFALFWFAAEVWIFTFRLYRTNRNELPKRFFRMFLRVSIVALLNSFIGLFIPFLFALLASVFIVPIFVAMAYWLTDTFVLTPEGRI